MIPHLLQFSDGHWWRGMVFTIAIQVKIWSTVISPSHGMYKHHTFLTLLSEPRVTFSYSWPASLLIWFSPSLSLTPKIWGTSLWVMLHFWSLDYCKQNELPHLHILVGFCLFGDIFRLSQLLCGVPNKLNGGLTTEIGLFGSLAGPIKDFHPGGKLLLRHMSIEMSGNLPCTQHQ